jgi:membrane associated rhomboid family serine protease
LLGWTSYAETSSPFRTGIATSIGVFVAWNWSNGTIQKYVNLPWRLGGQARQRARVYDFLTRNFTIKLADVKAGRYWNLITVAFSHIDVNHLLFNLYSFRTFSMAVIELGISPSRYLELIVGSAVVGHLAFLLQAASTVRQTNQYGQRIVRSALGLSGVTMGLAAAATCALPTTKVQIGLIPAKIPLWMATVGYAVYDAYSLNDPLSLVGHAAHLGGALFGALFFVVGLRGDQLPLL